MPNDLRHPAGRKPIGAPWAALVLSLLAGAACFPDWDRLDPSQGTGGQGAEGGGSDVGGGEPGGGDVGGSGGEGGSTFCEPGATVPCYGGPEGTEGVGICLGGETTCNAAGDGFGPCEGEVQPATEICGNQLDDDCDGETNEVDAGCTCTPGELIACYDGPMATEGVGLCVGGQALCQPDGQSTTACVGQVLPLHEECPTAGDDDCDGTANEGCPLWGQAFGINESNEDFASDAWVTPAGELLVTGRSEGTLDFGLGTLAPAEGFDIFLTKFDTDGNAIWARRWGSTLEDNGNAVTVDAAGNVYVVGEIGGPITIGSNDLAPLGSEDGVVVKLDAAGNVLWATTIGGAGADTTLFDVAVDAAGATVAVTGDFIAASPATVDVGSGPVSSTSGSRDGLVTKIDAATGAVTWGTSFGAGGDDTGRAVTFLGTSLAIAGHFDAEIDFGGTPIQDVSGLDGFVALVDAANTQQWIEGIGAGGNQYVYELASDGTNLYAQGDGNGTIDLGGNQVLADADDVFVLALSDAGNVLWGQHYVGPGNQHQGAIAVGGGSVWHAVSHELVLDYGDGPLSSSDDDDWALVKLDAMTGTTQKSVRIGGSGDQDPNGMGVDMTGNLYVAGECTGEVNFGLGLVDVTNSYEDICLAKLPP